MKKPKYPLTNLTFLILGLNALIDRGLHEGVTLDEAKKAIRGGTVFTWLRATFAKKIDVSIFEANPEAAAAISAEWQNLLDIFDGSERRKWGVEHNGICLLLAWTNELVQQHVWDDRD